jgi:hypothetical protein
MEPVPQARSQPSCGDVVVEQSDNAARFTVRRHPEPAQFYCTDREHALKVALDFARTHQVDLWWLAAGVARLLHVHRTDRSRPL